MAFARNNNRIDFHPPGAGRSRNRPRVILPYLVILAGTEKDGLAGQAIFPYCHRRYMVLIRCTRTAIKPADHFRDRTVGMMHLAPNGDDMPVQIMILRPEMRCACAAH